MRARAWHLLTAAVVAFAVVFQLVLVVRGVDPLLPEAYPSVGTRLVRFFSYFTILSNLLVLASTAPLVRSVPEGRLWRVLRLDAVVCIAVTGLVHWFVLRPLLDLHGASYAADKLLHVVSPLLAVIGWAVFGPRGRLGRADLLPALVFPVVWVAYTLVHGAVSRWYPYPFIDVGLHGYPRVLVSCLGVAALLLALSGAALLLDGRLPGVGVSRSSSDTTPRRPTGRT